MGRTMDEETVREIIIKALREDLGSGDITTRLTVSPGVPALGRIRAKEAGVVAGLEVAGRVFACVDPGLNFRAAVRDGECVSVEQDVAAVEGEAASMLQAERTALNFLQHMSGIATLTAKYVKAVEGYDVKIIDTRKTTPGLRILEKYAVRVGGGGNHRFCLDDGILIKDNHLSLHGTGESSITAAVHSARKGAPHTLKIEVEAETVSQVREAVEAGADVIMLDNMDPDSMRESVDYVRERCGKKVLLEASGKVTLDSVRNIAETGVDLISVGALTHSAPALDMTMEITPIDG